jgi:RNA polymerase sigma-70 factor (ECF subfamily)
MVHTFERKIRYPGSGILSAFKSAYRQKEPKSFMEAEKTLLTGLRGLDPQAITKIHETYFPPVYRYAHYRVGDDAVAEDLASETFIRLLEAVHAGREPHSSLRGWLMGTVSNLVNDYYRQVYNRSSEPLHEGLQASNGNPVSLSEQHSRQEILRSGLSRLTPDQQHVLALRFGSGCSLAETAEVMGKKPNAIKQLQFRALAALRRHIEAEI